MSPPESNIALPIDALLPEIVSKAKTSRALVIEAPPGAGKTTRVPRALLPAIDGEIIVLEPRRLAARMAADRVASELGEKVGETSGYRIRYEDRTSKKTRLTFVTEGILGRRLLVDRELKGVGAVILDEVHERHLQGDVALALVAALRRTTRPDLVVCAMSATLDAAPLATFLDAQIVRSEGRRFDVAIEYAEATPDRPLEAHVASAVRAIAKAEPDGHILVFLPGAREIRLAMEASESAARAHDLVPLPLHGDLTPEEQDRAVKRGPGRKVIFATNVAESSITIDGVVGVVDSGLARTLSHSPWSGLSELVVSKISRASAIQRVGRAGRTREGRAIRLYSKADFESRPEQDLPEIARADLAATALELHAHGLADIRFYEAPPRRAWEAAESLLTRLGAIDASGAVTAIGQKMLAHPLHPRIARMVIEGAARGAHLRAITLAAILGERDIRRESRAKFGDRGGADRATEDSDAVAMLDAFEEAKDAGFARHVVNALDLDPRALFAADRARTAMLRAERSPIDDAAADPDEALAIAILAGFPDRVTKRKRAGGRELIMPGFGAAELSETSVVRHAPFMVALDATERRPDGRSAAKPIVRIASAIDPLHILDLFSDRVEERAVVEFDANRERVTGKKELVYEGLPIDESPLDAKNDPRAADALFAAAWQKGLRTFAGEELDRWLARARFAHSQDTRVDAPSEDDLRATLRELCEGRSSFDELRHANVYDWVKSRTRGVELVERLAPDRVKLASGRMAKVEYEEGKPPFVESYLQDFCGTLETPRAGNVPIVLHLLAPNKRAVQVTTDLAGFWDRHYPQIRKELARKYPRHAWPEDPRTTIVPPKPRRA